MSPGRRAGHGYNPGKTCSAGSAGGGLLDPMDHEWLRKVRKEHRRVGAACGAYDAVNQP